MNLSLSTAVAKQGREVTRDLGRGYAGVGGGDFPIAERWDEGADHRALAPERLSLIEGLEPRTLPGLIVFLLGFRGFFVDAGSRPSRNAQ